MIIDLVFTIGSIVLAAGLIPLLRGQQTVSPVTAFTYHMVLLVFTVGYGVQGLYMTMVITAITSVLWGFAWARSVW